MVVSEIGEAWSPNTAPPRTALIEIREALSTASVAIPFFWARPTAIGITIGIMIAKVPQLVPVAKAIRAERRNTMAGTRERGKPPPTTTSDRYAARPRPPSAGLDLMIVPMDHAITRITSAGTMDLIPSISAEEASLIFISLLAR